MPIATLKRLGYKIQSAKKILRDSKKDLLFMMTIIDKLYYIIYIYVNKIPSVTWGLESRMGIP